MRAPAASDGEAVGGDELAVGKVSVQRTHEPLIQDPLVRRVLIDEHDPIVALGRNLAAVDLDAQGVRPGEDADVPCAGSSRLRRRGGR